MTTPASQLKELLTSLGLLKELAGPETTFQRIVAIEDCGPGDLVFIDKPDYVAVALERRPSVVVTSPALKDALSALPSTTIAVVASVPLAHAFIKQRWGARRFEDADWPRIHPSAIVHQTASVHETAFVEPRAVIGRDCVIGERSRIMAGAVIEHAARIGSDTVIHPNAVIGYQCTVGNQASIGAGTVVGSEGYGFAQDRKGRSHPIPQTGIVVIEDRVRVGANCAIDRAAYRVTRIGAGTKIDNLCHIAHNVIIGEDCLLTSMLCIAGSSQIGDRVMTSGQTGIIDHVKVGSNIALVHRAGVTKDITQPGVYAGAPAQPLADYLRHTAASRTVVDLRKRVQNLERQGGTPASAADSGQT